MTGIVHLNLIPEIDDHATVCPQFLDELPLHQKRYDLRLRLLSQFSLSRRLVPCNLILRLDDNVVRAESEFL